MWRGCKSGCGEGVKVGVERDIVVWAYMKVVCS